MLGAIPSLRKKTVRLRGDLASTAKISTIDTFLAVASTQNGKHETDVKMYLHGDLKGKRLLKPPLGFS